MRIMCAVPPTNTDGVFYLPQTQAGLFSGPGRMAAAAPQTANFLLYDMDGDGIRDIISYSMGDQAVYLFFVEELDEYESCMT
jgi:hypothetical protein